MQLPLEILAEIAYIFPNRIWTFACVCRQWRHAVLLHQKCWSRIRIKYTGGAELPPNLKAHFDLWVERAGGSQLELFLEGSFHQYLLSARLAGCLSGICKLHLDWPQEFDAQLQQIYLPCLEALSINAARSSFHSSVALSTLFAAFLEKPCQPESAGLFKVPRLHDLALDGVYINISTFPGLPTIGKLKLANCLVDLSISFLDFLDKARCSLEALCLWNVESLRYRPPISALETRRVEYPRLESLTLRCDRTSWVQPRDVISHIVCPSLIKLTCDDTFLPLLNPCQFPKLSDLYVDSFQSSSHKTYEKVLMQFGIAALTIFRNPRSRECGFNALLWSMSRSPEFGKTIRRFRYLSTESLPQTIMLVVNRQRRGVAGEAAFASQTVVNMADVDEHYSPWELWWTRK